MTLRTCGQRRRYAQGKIDAIAWYVATLDRLNAPQKIILILLIDVVERGPPAVFQPSLVTLARLCSCSRKSAWRALRGLSGRHGWIINEWRGGRQTNLYFAGWRLTQLMLRTRRR